MTPSDFILLTLSQHHRGKAQAITRFSLARILSSRGIYLTDRELRAIYSELPVCTCEKGIYWPETKAELEEYRVYLRAKAIPMFERWQRVAQAHPELIDAKQGDLFQ